jgi:hypothetical protein
MPKKVWTEEEKKALGEKLKAAREAKKNQAAPQQPDVIGAELPEEDIVGAKLTVDNSEIKSMLEDITEDSEVDIYNPLDQGFRVQFTITAYQQVNLTPQERDVREKAGMPLAKDMNQSIGHAVKFTVLPSHKVTRLPGKVAHVAIKQLRNYIMRMDTDNYVDVADPARLREYEERIVMKISNSLEAMQIDQSSEIDRKIAELNHI